MAWFAILLPVMGVLCLIKGKDATQTGWLLIGFGWIDLTVAWFTRTDSSWATHRDF